MATRGDGMAQLLDRVVLAERHVQALRHSLHDSVHVACLRQIAEPGSSRIVTQPGPRKAQRQAGLAGTADAQQ